jgi:internalin A
MIVLFFFSISAFGQANFIKKCEELPDLVSLKDIFNTKDCYEIAKKIKDTKSFSEIILPNKRIYKKNKTLASPWTDDFPYMYGINGKSMHNFYTYRHDWDETWDKLITKLEMFQEFNNFVHITYLPSYPYYSGPNGICKIIKMFPSLKMITLESKNLKNPFVDNCLSQAKIEGVIINNPFKGYEYFKPKTKIIGIEYYEGDFESLNKFRSLRYIGISNDAKTLNGLESLYGLTELTHFSLNLKGSMSDLYKIGLLKNLTYLNLTCVNLEKENSPYLSGCEDSKLTDIRFMSKLNWIEHLNLSYHSIKDITPLLSLNELRSLKLRGNLIEKLPPMSILSKLKYLDLSGNKLISVNGLEKLTNLYFLNLSGNQLTRLSPLETLTSLKFLNLSNNPKQIINLNKSLESLKVLNINGGGGSPSMELKGSGVFNTIFNDFKKEEKYLIEALFHDFTLSPEESAKNKCATYPSIFNNQNLNRFPNLEILSMKNNDFETAPDISQNTKLRYINLERNKLKHIDQHSFPDSLESLQLEINSFVNIPSLETLGNLKQLNLSNNDVSEIKNISSLPANVHDLDLSDNLIEDVSPLISNMGHVDYYSFFASIRIYRNPILKNTHACPINTDSFINQICSDYLEGKQGMLTPPKKIDGIPVVTSRSKCGITFLGTEPHKRSFSLSNIDWFEN